MHISFRKNSRLLSRNSLDERLEAERSFSEDPSLSSGRLRNTFVGFGMIFSLFSTGFIATAASFEDKSSTSIKGTAATGVGISFGEDRPNLPLVRDVLPGSSYTYTSTVTNYAQCPTQVTLFYDTVKATSTSTKYAKLTTSTIKIGNTVVYNGLLSNMKNTVPVIVPAAKIAPGAPGTLPLEITARISSIATMSPNEIGADILISHTSECV